MNGIKPFSGGFGRTSTAECESGGFMISQAVVGWMMRLGRIENHRHEFALCDRGQGLAPFDVPIRPMMTRVQLNMIA